MLNSSFRPWRGVIVGAIHKIERVFQIPEGVFTNSIANAVGLIFSADTTEAFVLLVYAASKGVLFDCNM